MQEVNYGRKTDSSFFLEPAPDLVAVRTLPGAPALADTSAIASMEEAQLVMRFESSGLSVFKLPTQGSDLQACKRCLRNLPVVRFAGSVLVTPGTLEPVIYTENMFIKFVDALTSQDCETVIKSAGLTIKQQLDYAQNAYFVTPGEGSGTQVFSQALCLLEHADVEYCHPELLTQRRSRTIHPNQWHLKKTTVTYQYEIDASANVEAAHALSQGENVVIAVIDDAFDIDHPEFSSADKIVAPRSFRNPRQPSNDPRPQDSDESHGTAAAGVACADGLHGASGVAPKARLMPISLGDSDSLGGQAEANAFVWAVRNGADIISCSWGPPDGNWADPSDPAHDEVHRLPANIRLAIDYAAIRGRKGKGCPIFFAAGNGNESVDNDGYASHTNVIAVAACNDHNRRSAYSDYGKAIWCAFPSDHEHHPDANFEPASSAPRTRGIWTTDLRGRNGYNDKSPGQGDPWGNYTENFGGTSSACPGLPAWLR
ncbi:S8 family peptidase [Pseudomonas sp. TH31]|uniref:S8 family peptidase n=1 Tax=Pseudomonas sp. TH31 TaxID=2796396 RepID=UPI0019131312|nr:S8 family serine peptidase [Pseudomonas sp. TH31]MBK5417027.1 S8 family serine peptidase [Pseudomonas sp. TH31]